MTKQENQVLENQQTVTGDKIHRSMTIDELFMRFPQKAQKLAQVLTKAGLNCVGCSASTWETIESGCIRHCMDEVQIVELLEKLNRILEETSDPSLITLTAKAAQKFKEICDAEGKTGWAIRFDEIPAGCSGFEYVLDFSEKPNTDDPDEEDIVFSMHGVDIHVSKRVVNRLRGCEIDFADGLQPGFKISNPNARSSCGCGSSHGYDG